MAPVSIIDLEDVIVRQCYALCLKQFIKEIEHYMDPVESQPVINWINARINVVEDEAGDEE